MFTDLKPYRLKTVAFSLLFLLSLIFLLFILKNPVNKKALLTPEEKEWLLSHKNQISISFDPSFAPFEFYDSEGNPKGYSADLIALIEKKIDFNFKKITSKKWFDVMKGLKEEKIDITPSIAASTERKDFLNFTKPHLKTSCIIVTTDDEKRNLTLNDLKDKKVGVASGYIYEESIRKDYPDLNLISFPSEKEGLMKLSIKEIDAMVIFISSAVYYIQELNLPNLKIAGPTGYDIEFSIAIRKGLPLLHSILDKALDSITPDEKKSISKKWLSLEAELFYQNKKFWMFFLLLIAVSAGFIALISIWNHLLKRQVNRQTLELKKNQEYLSTLFNSIQSILFSISPSGKIIRINQEIKKYLSSDTGTFIGKNFWEALPFLEKYKTQYSKILDSKAPLSFLREPVKLNAQYFFNIFFIPFQFHDETGLVVRIDDVSEIEHKEFQLQQSQKIETVGMLAGGIAHDFNNLLSPILGYSEILLSKITPGDENFEELSMILQAAEKAKDLTQQLLAFGRKQKLELKTVDLFHILSDFERLLRHTIREDIHIKFKLSKTLYPVKADKGQIEQVLLNLAVNSQDAMPQEGLLTIEASNIYLDEFYVAQKPEFIIGKYVVITVSDNGAGMSEETAARIFEPFFTTKEVGKGTGLGLSIVHGIIKQHQGHIEVYSEKGHGTCFKIYLPAIEEEKPLPDKDEKSTAEVLTGNETIFIVEDNEMVRNLVCHMLSHHGYKVFSDSNGEHCLDRLALHQTPVHLLLTDIIMPKMNGKELYDKIKILKPGIKVLFMSGYTDLVITRHGVLEKDINFIQKPFTMQNLLKKVRGVLDS